jgi:chromosome condensin MukBEF complex kleisin-like MukF subunit
MKKSAVRQSVALNRSGRQYAAQAAHQGADERHFHVQLFSLFRKKVHNINDNICARSKLKSQISVG